MKKIVSLCMIIIFIFSTIHFGTFISYGEELYNQNINSIDLDLLEKTVSDTTDTDNDGLTDTIERIIGTSVEKIDTDDDGLNDLFEVENSLSPLKKDSNSDGLDDLYELTGGNENIEITTSLLERDTDKDGIANILDEDNDNDGVIDKIDLSPFSYIDNTEDYSMSILTSGVDTIANIQIQPSDVEKLYNNNKIISWPKDDEGSIRNYDGKEGGVSTVPMLEIVMDDYPDLATREAYGYILLDNKLLIPLERIEQEGEFVALEGTLFIPKNSGKKLENNNYKVDISFKLKWSLLALNDNINAPFNKVGLLYFDGEIVSLEDIRADGHSMYLGSNMCDLNSNNLPDFIIYYTRNIVSTRSDDKYTLVKVEKYYDLKYDMNKGAFIASRHDSSSIWNLYYNEEYKTEEGYLTIGKDAEDNKTILNGKVAITYASGDYRVATVLEGDTGALKFDGKYIPKVDERKMDIAEKGFYFVNSNTKHSNIRDAYYKYDSENDTIWYLYQVYDEILKKDRLILKKNYKVRDSYITSTISILDNLVVDSKIDAQSYEHFSGIEKGVSLDLFDLDNNGELDLLFTDLSGKIYVINDINEGDVSNVIELPLKQNIELVHGQSIAYVDTKKDNNIDMVLIQAKRDNNEASTDLDFKISIKDDIVRNSINIMSEYDTFKITGIQIEEKHGIETGVIYGEDTNQLLKMNMIFKYLFMNDDESIGNSVGNYIEETMIDKGSISTIYGNYDYYFEAMMDVGRILAEDIPTYKTEKPVTILTKEKNKYLNLDELSVLDYSKKSGKFDFSTSELVTLKRMTIQWIKDNKTLGQKEINIMVEESSLDAIGNEYEATKELLAEFNMGLSNIVKVGDTPKILPSEFILNVYKTAAYPDSVMSGINRFFVSKPIQTIGNVGWQYNSKLARYNTYTRYSSGISGIGTIANVALAIHSGYMYGRAMAKAGGTTFGITSGITYGVLVFATTYLYTALAAVGPIGWVLMAIIAVDTLIAFFVDDYDGVVSNVISAVMSFFFDVQKYPGTYIHRMKVTKDDIEFRNTKDNRISIGSEVEVLKEFLISIRGATKSTPANKKSVLEKGYANFNLYNISGGVNVDNDKDRIYKDLYKQGGYWYEDKLYQFNNTLIFNKPGINLEVISKSILETKLCDEVTYTSYLAGIYENLEYSWDTDITRISHSSYYDILPNSLSQLYDVMDSMGLTFYDDDGDGLMTKNGHEIDGNGEILKSSPYKYDTDEDGVDDYIEFMNDTDPRKGDTDGDGLTDKEEIRLKTDPNKIDTDEDGLSDYQEVSQAISTTIVVNGKSMTITTNTNPLLKDSDGDGLLDKDEINQGSNPTSKHSNGQILYDGNNYKPNMRKMFNDNHDILENEVITYTLDDYFEDLDGDKLYYNSNVGTIKDGIFEYNYNAKNGKVIEVEITAMDHRDGNTIASFIIEDTTGPYIKEVSTISPEKIVGSITGEFTERIQGTSVFEFKFNQAIKVKDANKIRLIPIDREELDIDSIGRPAVNNLITKVSGSTLTVYRKTNLVENGIEYELKIQEGALADLAGNSFEEVYNTTFRTIDTIKPVLTSISKTVNLNQELVLTFNEDIYINEYKLHIIDDLGQEYDLVTERDDTNSMKVLVVSNLLDSHTIYQISDNIKFGTDYAMDIKDINGNMWNTRTNTISKDMKSFTTGDVAGPKIADLEVKLFGEKVYKVDWTGKELVVEFNENIYPGEYYDHIILSYDRSLAVFGNVRDKLLREEIKTFGLEKEIRIENNKLIITPKEDLPILKDENGEAISMDLSYSIFIPQKALRDVIGNSVKDDWNENDYIIVKYGRDELYLKIYAGKMTITPPKLVTIISPVENDGMESARTLIESYTDTTGVEPSKYIFAIFNKDVIVSSPNHLDKSELWRLDEKGQEVEKIEIEVMLPTQSFFGFGSYGMMISLNAPLKENEKYKFILPSGLVKSATSFDELDKSKLVPTPNSISSEPLTNVSTRLRAYNSEIAFDGINAPSGLPDELPDETPNELPNELPDEIPNELPNELPDELPSGLTLPEDMTLEEYLKLTVNDYQELVFTVNNKLEGISSGIKIDKDSFIGLLRAGEYIISTDKFEKYVEMTKNSLSYQWYRSDDKDEKHGKAITGANSLVYKITNDDIGKYLFLQINVDYKNRSEKSFVSPALGPIESALSSENTLIDILIETNGKELIRFNKDVKDYYIEVEEDVEHVNIKVTSSKLIPDLISSDDFTIDDLGNEPLDLPLKIGENTFTIRSLSEDFTSSTEYKISILRLGKPVNWVSDIEDGKIVFTEPMDLNLELVDFKDNTIIVQAKVLDNENREIFAQVDWIIPDGFQMDYDKDTQMLILFAPDSFDEKSVKIKASLKKYLNIKKEVILSLEVKKEIGSFVDVTTDKWFYEPINFLSNKEMVNGVGKGKFAPNVSISRADFLIIAMRAFDIELIKGNGNFADAGNTYYTEYLATAKKMKLVNGVGDNEFSPKEKISRQDAFLILYNILSSMDKLPKYGNTDIKEFKDISYISGYAFESMKSFVSTDIIQGNNGYLKPRDNTTRAEATQIIYKVISLWE